MVTITPVPIPLANMAGGTSEAHTRPVPLPSAHSAAPTVSVSPQAVQPIGASDNTGAAHANHDELKSAVEKVSKAVSGYTSELKFSVDEDLGVSVVKVIDTQSDQVIRQIPSVEMLNIAKGIEKALGMLLEQKA